jgi:hypothetical protein
MGNRSTKTPVSQWGRSTLAALAEALGVHRNWVSELVDRGAPGGPPYCELAWRTWMAANGHDAKRAPDKDLLDLLAKSGIPQYRKLLLGDQADEQKSSSSSSGSGSTGLLDEERQAKAEADRAETEAQLSAIKVGKEARTIIHVDNLHRLVDAIGLLFIPLMRGVPEACTDAINRAAVEEAIAANQEQLVPKLEITLKTFLEELARER